MVAHAVSPRSAATSRFAAAGLFHLDAGGGRSGAVEVALDADDLCEFLRIGAARLDTELEQTIGNRRVLRRVAGLPRQQPHDRLRRSGGAKNPFHEVTRKPG